MKKKNRKKKLNNDKVLFRRIKVLKVIIFLFFSTIIFKISYLNIYMGTYYKMLLNNKTSDIVLGSSVPRGIIYDRNGKILVDNTQIKTIVYQRKRETSSEEEISLAYEISKIIDLDYSNLLEINLKEFYMLINKEKVDKKITNEEYQNYYNRKLSEEDLYNLKIKKITKEELDSLKEFDKKAANLYYLMNKGYYYDEKIIKKDNVTDKEYAYFLENSDELKGFKTGYIWERVYPYGDVIRGILGKVSSSEIGIPKEELGHYLSIGYKRNDRVGLTGLEKQYEEILKGTKATYKILEDNSLELIKEGKKGTDIVLGIDIELQIKIEEMLKKEILKAKKEPNTEFFNRSFVVICDPRTGEIMAMVGKQLVTNEQSKKQEFYDFAEGAMLSSVTPGSIVKGASISVGYKTKVIDIGSIINDKCIKFLNMPEKCSWVTMGNINDLAALSRSSNVYQFKIAMMIANFKYSYNTKLDIDLKAFDIYRNMFYQFGLGVKTGIDYPREDIGYTGNSLYGDLLLNFTIGQYDTYTPLQITQYIATLANNGTRMKTSFLRGIINEETKKLEKINPIILNKIDLDKKYFDRIKEGFKAVISRGTGYFYMGNSPSPAGKTGTSESFVDINGDNIVDYESISNNFIGYAPSDSPVMAISVICPDVQNPNRGSARTRVNYRISKNASEIFFSLYNKKGERITK